MPRTKVPNAASGDSQIDTAARILFCAAAPEEFVEDVGVKTKLVAEMVVHGSDVYAGFRADVTDRGRPETDSENTLQAASSRLSRVASDRLWASPSASAHKREFKTGV